MAEQQINAGEFLFDPVKMSWAHQYYDLPFIWKDLKTRGKGAVVAVIDTGIDKTHPDLISNIHPSSKNILDNTPGIDDTNGHGTRMAGIIAGSGKQHVFGVAPEAQLLVIKATTTKFGAQPKKFAVALREIAGMKEVDIISISYTFGDDPDLKREIELCLGEGKIIVAPTGNMRDDDLPEDPDTFPSGYNTGKENTGNKDVLATGAFNSNKALCTFSNWNRHISFLAPGDKLLTCNTGNSTINETGTSIATAFTAGCLALMVSWAKINGKTGLNLPSLLLTTCDDYGPHIGYDIKSGFGLMNFRNALSKLK